MFTRSCGKINTDYNNFWFTQNRNMYLFIFLNLNY